MEEFLMHQPGSFTAQTQGGKGVRNQAEDFGHSGTKTPKDLREYSFKDY